MCPHSIIPNSLHGVTITPAMYPVAQIYAYYCLQEGSGRDGIAHDGLIPTSYASPSKSKVFFIVSSNPILLSFHCSHVSNLRPLARIDSTGSVQDISNAITSS